MRMMNGMILLMGVINALLRESGSTKDSSGLGRATSDDVRDAECDGFSCEQWKRLEEAGPPAKVLKGVSTLPNSQEYRGPVSRYNIGKGYPGKTL